MTTENYKNEEFEFRLWLSTVQLCRLMDRSAPPVGAASGCLIDYRGKRLLLSVSHATGREGRWAMQVRYAPGKGTQLYELAPMNFLAKEWISGSGREPEIIDFSYVDVPKDMQAWHQEIELGSNAVKNELPTLALAPSLTEMPNADETYGFSGTVMHEIEPHPWQTYFTAEARIYTGLKFLRTEDDFHYFSLAFKHPGHIHFKGCSGAPILSSAGALVALLSGGDPDTNEVWGTSTSAYKTAIDIHVQNLDPIGT